MPHTTETKPNKQCEQRTSKHHQLKKRKEKNKVNIDTREHILYDTQCRQKKPLRPPTSRQETKRREGGRRIMTTKKQKNGRSRDRLFVYKQTRDQGEKKKVSSVASVSTSWRNNQQPSSVGSKTLLGKKIAHTSNNRCSSSSNNNNNNNSRQRRLSTYIPIPPLPPSQPQKQRQQDEQKPPSSPRVRVRNNTNNNNNNNAAEQNQRKPGSQPAAAGLTARLTIGKETRKPRVTF
jgi:hypothetical protein